MARITAAVVCLLGLLACSALAHAQTANVAKSDPSKTVGHAVEEVQIKRDSDSFMRSKHEQTITRESSKTDKTDKTDKDELKEAHQPDNKDKPEVKPRHHKKMPRHVQFQLQATNIGFAFEEPKQVGSNAVLSFDLVNDGVKVAKAVLTGTATTINTTTEILEFNSLMTIEAEQMEGTTLIAGGYIGYDDFNKVLLADHDTLTILGGSGEMAGAQGIITLAGGDGVGESVSFDIVLPKHRHHVEAEQLVKENDKKQA